MNKKTLIGLIVVLVIVATIVTVRFYAKQKSSVTTAGKSQKEILIGFSLGTLQEERWQKDRSEFLKKADELGAVVDVKSANNDADTQISQIEGMIVKGVDVLVIVPQDAENLTDVIDKAHQAGIKVISYDRLIKNADVDLYVSFDSEKVGEYQADYVLRAVADKITAGQKLKVAYIGGAITDNNAILLKNGSFRILQPKIDSGEIEIVLDKFTDNWSPENAYKNLEEYLDNTNGAIDAVVAANDGTAFGSITALSEYGLDGKVPVSGQDAELSAIKRIVQGTQTVSVYKPISKLASVGAELAIKLAKGETITQTGTINNGKIDVPAVLLESVSVTKENIEETVIKDGFYSREDIY